MVRTIGSTVETTAISSESPYTGISCDNSSDPGRVTRKCATTHADEISPAYAAKPQRADAMHDATAADQVRGVEKRREQHPERSERDVARLRGQVMAEDEPDPRIRDDDGEHIAPRDPPPEEQRREQHHERWGARRAAAARAPP
jgi:hypothetical protein